MLGQIDLSSIKSDSELVIASCAMLDKCLAELVRGKMTGRDSAKNELLGQFRNVRLMAYTMGLITDQELDDLDIVGQIRNIFAHAYPQPTFESRGIVKKCERMAIYHRVRAWGLEPRQVYVMSVNRMAQRFIVVSGGVSYEQLSMQFVEVL